MVTQDVAAALLQIAEGDLSGAIDSCRGAAGFSPLAHHLANYLAGPATEGVYTSPEGFDRFISGGSNVALYEATIEALAVVNKGIAPASLLDIGCGDGRITQGSLPKSCKHLHLLDPSETLLESAKERFHESTCDVTATCSNVQEMLQSGPHLTWDAVQATFAMHNLQPDQRRDALTDLAGRIRFLSLVEFDVPDFVDKSPEHAAFAADAYEAGVGEYVDDQLVIDGFLLPVLVGQFAQDRPRHTYEQSATSWSRDLANSGFDSISTRQIYSYWWAEAFLVTASGSVG